MFAFRKSNPLGQPSQHVGKAAFHVPEEQAA
jgi:hypothetical protein